MNQQEYIKKFKEITDYMLELTTRKNSDYATEQNPRANFMACEFLGITNAENGILTRILDKIQRVANLLKKDNPSVNDESIEDSCIDGAVYLIILAIYLKDKSNKNKININIEEQTILSKTD